MTKDPQITITGLSPLQFTIKDKQGREHPVNEENAYIPQVDTLQVRKNLETREHEKISRILEIIASPTKTEKQIKEVLELVLQIDIAGMNTSELQQMKDYFRDCLQANVIRALAKVLKKRLSGGRESLSIVQEMFQAIDNASGVRDRYQAR